MLDRADDRQRRSRRANGCTQYPVPLPVASAPRLLSVEIADYVRSRDDRGLAKDTTGSTFRTLTLLKMACGDIPVSRIDHAHIYRLWELLRWAPPLLLSDPKYRGYTYDQAVALGKELAVPPLAPKTLEKHRRFLSTFFKGLVEANAIPASPWRPSRSSRKTWPKTQTRQSACSTNQTCRKSSHRRPLFHGQRAIPTAGGCP